MRRLCRTVFSTVGSLVVAMGMVVVAWGGSATPSSAGASPAIPIGFMCDCSGPDSSSLAAWAPGVHAWTQWTNAHGGVNGQSIKIFEIDTQSNQSNYIPAFRQLTQADHVVAIIPGIASVTTLSPLLAAANMPLLGGVQDVADFITNPLEFPSGTTDTGQLGALVGAAAKVGHKKFGAAVPAGAGSAFAGVLGPIAAKFGVKLAGQVEAPSGAPNYDAQCLSLQGSGANSVALFLDPATSILFSQACASQGYHPTYVTPGAAETSAMTKAPSLNGLLISEPNIPYYSHSAATADFNAAMQRYESRFLASALYGASSIAGWISGQMLITAVAKGHQKGSVTSAEIIDGLYKFRNETLGGLVPPLTFIKGQPKNVNCFFIGGISHGKLTTPFGPKAICG